MGWTALLWFMMALRFISAAAGMEPLVDVTSGICIKFLETAGQNQSVPGPTSITNGTKDVLSFSFDGNTLYFMRDGTEWIGGESDLYISRKGLDGKCGSPAENMGPPINSPTSERSIGCTP
jgi:hypothetical protein